MMIITNTILRWENEMSHLVFDSPYHFYDLPESERIKLIGRVFKERKWVLRGSKKKVVYTDETLPSLYIPIGLAQNEFNYGIQQGVLIVTGVHSNWFKVGAFSPDDLDIDLQFAPEHTYLRQDIIDFIRGPMHKQNRRYLDVLKQIQQHFKAGKITS